MTPIERIICAEVELKAATEQHGIALVRALRNRERVYVTARKTSIKGACGILRGVEGNRALVAWDDPAGKPLACHVSTIRLSDDPSR